MKLRRLELLAVWRSILMALNYQLVPTKEFVDKNLFFFFFGDMTSDSKFPPELIKGSTWIKTQPPSV